VESAWIGTGANIYATEIEGVSIFRQLAPESKLLATDFSSYSGNLMRSMMSGSSFSAQVGFRFGSRERQYYRANPVMRIGLNYSSGTWLQGIQQKDSVIFRDTLFSSQTGQTIYVDSVERNNYYMNYNSDQLRLDVSFLFSTPREARWALYGGIGLQTGFSLRAETRIDYLQTIGTETMGNGSYPIASYDRFTGSSEQIRHRGNFYAGFYLPVGVDFRLGKKRPLLKMMHLYAETRPAAGYVSISGIPGYLRTSTQVITGIYIRI
jgi:hypothetical protein